MKCSVPTIRKAHRQLLWAMTVLEDCKLFVEAEDAMSCASALNQYAKEKRLTDLEEVQKRKGHG